MNKQLKDWTYDDLRNHVIARLFDALIRGGTKEMSVEFHNVFDIIGRWLDIHRNKL